MLSASKLCQSVSTSGPSATWKPSPMKTSSSRSHACVTRWAWPRTGLPANSVRSSRSAATRAAVAALPSCVVRVADCLGHLLHRLVHGLAGGALLLDRGEPAELRLELRQRALLAQQPAVERGHRLERVGGVDLGERRVTCGGDLVDHEWSFPESCRYGSGLPGWTQVRVANRASALPGCPPGARKSQAASRPASLVGRNR